MDHNEPYPEGYVAGILDEVQTIAVVGASPRDNRPSHIVMQTLIEAGYEVFPVNPYATGLILGRKVYATLADVPKPADMVDVFRQSAALMGVAEEAIAIQAQVIWTQLAVIDHAAAALAEAAGLRIVMNRCPRIELGRMDRL